MARGRPLLGTFAKFNKEFDVEITANLGTKEVRGVGEVRWTSMGLPHFFKMGIFLKEMREDAKEKWANFVTRQSKNIPRNAISDSTCST